MSRQTVRQVLLASFAVLALSAPAHAEEPARGWVGAQGGLAVPSANNTSSRGMYGLTFGAKLGDNLGIGGYYQTSHQNENSKAFNYDMYGVQLSYHFDGDATGAWFGGRIGTSKVDIGDGSTYSPMNYGVVAGYDYVLASHISLGGEVNWMTISSSAPLTAFSTLDFLGALKFWF